MWWWKKRKSDIDNTYDAVVNVWKCQQLILQEISKLDRKLKISHEGLQEKLDAVVAALNNHTHGEHPSEVIED